MLAFSAVATLAFGLVLLTPDIPAEGPATVVVYDFLARETWGLLWTFLSLAPSAALVWPTAATRRWAVSALTIASFCWLVMLSLPLVLEPHVGNALATLAWTVPVALGTVTVARVGFTDRSTWRPVVSTRR